MGEETERDKKKSTDNVTMKIWKQFGSVQQVEAASKPQQQPNKGKIYILYFI